MTTITGRTGKSFVLKERIGGGLSSIVYRGHQKDNPENVVAVKVIDRVELLKVSVHAEVYLQREIAILQQLDHPNIVKLIDYLDDGKTNTVYLVLEYCQGGSLREYLNKKNKLGEQEVNRLLSQLVDALKYMYSKSIIHRDLKPHNILLTEAGTVKICDYGFARFYEKTKLMISILGSPLYMAPEIIDGSKYTAKCDLWSLGIIMHEMLSGTLPYNTNNIVHLDAFYRRREITGIEFPRGVDASDECKNLLCTLLKVRPEDRITWPDFFQHPFFLSRVDAPSSPLLSTRATDNGLISIIAVPHCDKIEVNVSELDETCSVRLFKMSLTTKLQLDASNLSDSNPPILLLCTPTGVVEMEDDKPLSIYNNLFSRNEARENVKLMYVDVYGQQDTAGEIFQQGEGQGTGDSNVGQEEVQGDDNSEVGCLVRDFTGFVTKQNYYYAATEQRFSQCSKYLSGREALLSTVKQAMVLLGTNVKALNSLSHATLELYSHQNGVALGNITSRFPAHIQDLRSVVLHNALRDTTGHATLLDLAGGEEAIVDLLEQAQSADAELKVLIEGIKSVRDVAESGAHTAIRSEDKLQSLKGTQREAQQWVEGLRLYREHTAKWASVVLQHKRESADNSDSNNDVGEIEWSFVVDGLHEVRAGCEHDLGVAEKLVSRVTDHWHRCVNSHVDIWEDLSSRLKNAMTSKDHVIKAIHTLPKLGQLLLAQQARIERLEAIINLPDVYQVFLHTLYNKFVFVNRTADLLDVFGKQYERQIDKLASFHTMVKGKPFEELFKQGIDLVASTSIPNLLPTITPSRYDVGDIKAALDDEFNVVVPEEDSAALVQENAMLRLQMRQLGEEKRTQDAKWPIEHMLGIAEQNKNLLDDVAMAKDVAVQRESEIQELRAKCDEFARMLKEREDEKEKEKDEFTVKFVTSIERYREMSRKQQAENEAKIKSLEAALAEAKEQAQERETQHQVDIIAVQDVAHSSTKTAELAYVQKIQELQTTLTEKNDALMSIQGALDDNETAAAEMTERIKLLLKIQEEQASMNNMLQQRLQQQQQQIQQQQQQLLQYQQQQQQTQPQQQRL